MCDWKITTSDTGRRKQHRKPGGSYPEVIYEHRWTAQCGASGGPYTSKSKAVNEACDHVRACPR